jgi:hypothetical protein
MDTQLLDAIAHAKKHISPKAYPIHHIHGDRWIYGFDGHPFLFVVADSQVTQLGLAILVIEATAVCRAMQVASETHQALANLSLRETPTQGGVQ